MNSKRIFCFIVVMDVLAVAVFARKRQKDSCKCGKSNGDTSLTVKDEFMIINGAAVEPPDRYPWMVSIIRDGKYVCGGTLVSKDYVITAGHCLERDKNKDKVNKTHCYDEKNRVSKCYYEPKEMKVTFVTKTYAMSRNQKVKNVIVHPKYAAADLDYDMALLQLERPVKCKNSRRPICLPKDRSLVKPGTKAIATGWGNYQVHAKGGGSTKLLATMLIFITNKKCKMESKINLNTSICAIGFGEQGMCFGDSGGPVFGRKNRRYYLSAIVSAVATGNCETNLPAFFSPIYANIKWISQYVKQEE